MEEYFEEGPSLPIETKPIYGGYRKKLIDKMLPKTPSTLYKLVQNPRKCKCHDDDNEVSIFDVPICSASLPQASITEIRSDLRRADKIVYLKETPKEKKPVAEQEYDFKEVLENVTEKVQTVKKTQPACKTDALEKAVSKKSTLVYVPIKLKLTDKHLAQMTPSPGLEVFWPQRWQFKDNLGSFLCVVERIDENNYEFKVLMIPGSYTEDPVTLAMLMKLFNPLYHTGGYNRETAIKNARMIVASAANEFFGPQIVESCIAVWLSYRRNQQITIKKSDMILKMNNVKLNGPFTSLRKKSPRTNPAGTSSARVRPTTSLSQHLTTTTRHAHYLTAIFGYNRAMYPDLRTLTTPQNMLPVYDHIREIHLNEGQLYHLLADFPPFKDVVPEDRTKG